MFAIKTLYLCSLFNSIFPMSCKGICIKYDRIGGGNQSAYKLGYKRCSECNTYIRFSGSLCPCCHYRLRSKKKYD